MENNTNNNYLSMKELQEKLKLSRQTITRYIKAGLPRLKKGHENLFNFKEVTRWIERNDSNPEYAKLVYEAYELYPNEPLKVLEHIKNSGNDLFYILSMAETTQTIYSMHVSGKIKIDSGFIDYFFRGFLDCARHLPKNLPPGVFHYIASRVEDLVIELIHQSNRPRYIQKKVLYFDDVFDLNIEAKNRINNQLHETFFSKRGEINND